MSKKDPAPTTVARNGAGSQLPSKAGRSRLRRYTLYSMVCVLLLVILLAAGLSTFLATESGSRVVVNFAAEQISKIEELNVSVGSIRGNMLQGLQLDDISFTGAGVTVAISELVLAWDPFSLFAGQLVLSELRAENITVVQLESDPEPNQSSPTNPIADFSFTPLPVAVTIENFELRDLELQVAGQSSVVRRLSAWVELDAAELNVTELQFEAADAELNGLVALSLAPGLPITSELNWRYAGSLPLNYESASGQLVLGGSLDSLTVSHRLKEPFNLISNGRVEAMAGPNPELELRHESALLEIAVPEYPLRLEDFGLNMKGGFSALDLTLSSSIQVEDLPNVEADIAARLNGSGIDITRAQLDTDTGVVNFSSNVSWENGLTATGQLRLSEANPLAYVPVETPVSLSRLDGEMTYEANLQEESRRIAVAIESLSAQVDEYEVSANGLLEMRDSLLLIDSLTLLSSDNRLHITGNYGDEIDLQWQIDAPVLEQFVPGFSGSLEGSGFARGYPLEPDIEADLSLRSLSREEFQIGNLDLQVAGVEGDYKLNLAMRDGVIEDSPVRTIHSVDASIIGSADKHEFIADIATDRGSFSLELDGGFEDLEALDWQGSLKRAALGGDAGDWQLVRAVQIAWRDSQVSVDQGCWRLDSVRLCFTVTPGDGGEYAMSGELQGFPLSEFNAGQEHLLEIASIPRLPLDVTLAGTADANLFARLVPGQAPQLNFDTRAMSPSLILRTVETDEFGAITTEAEVLEQTYTWRELSLAGGLKDGEWALDASASLGQRLIQDISNDLNGALSANLVVDEDGGLNGTASANFNDLGWVAAFVPDVSSVTGSLRSQVNLVGSLDSPEFTGELSVINGSLLVDRTGVMLSDLEFNFISDSPERARLQGSVGTDQGAMSFSGEIQQLNTPLWQLTAELEGENLQLADRPDLQLRVTPELELQVNARQIRLRGDLRLPTLNLALRELPESAVDISRDVVITSFPEDRPELERSFTTGQTSIMSLPVVMDLNLLLGEDVTLDAFGLQAELAGNLSIQQSYNGTNLTYGELSIVQGSYQIYGQKLRLYDGELLFLGNYNNPALNIRAVREVDNLTVGVLMNGTLDNIRSELFSTPTLPESDIVSVLITGRPVSELRSGEETSVIGAITTLGLRQSESLSQQIGQRLGLDTFAITSDGDVDSSELTVGKYLTPKVFIRYGIGLFDNESKVAVDYSINDRLTLHAESGEYQSLDLTYKVER